MNTTMDSLVIDIQSTSTDATQGIDSLIERLTSLRDVLREVSTASNGLSSLKNIGSNVKTSRTSKKQEKIEQPEIIAKNIQTTPLFDEMAGKIGKVDSATSMLQNKLNMLNVDLGGAKILSTFSKLNTTTTKYLTKAGSVVTVTDKMKDEFNSVDVSVRKTNPKVRTFTDNLNTLVGVTNKVRLGLVATATAVVGTIKKIGEFVNKAGAGQEALNLFTVTMGKYAEEGTKWLQRFSNALYLDPVEVMQYMGSFNSLVKGLGVGAENSYKMSQNLTQLVYDLSSFKNISIQSAYEKLMSGISGELEPLRNVGVAMSEATLQTLAYDLGINKLVRNMTEAEKAQLRYVQIMKSSSEWQTDMGRTLISPANTLRVMRQQFTLLGRAIGNVFIPILMTMIPYVMVITEWLSTLAKTIAKFVSSFLGVEVDFSLDTGSFDTSIGDITGGLEEVGNAADSTKNKLNTMLAPFDELNVVQNKTESAGSGIGGGGVGGDLGVDLPTYDALSKLTDKFRENIDKARENLKSLLPIVTSIGISLAAFKLAGLISDIKKSTKEMSKLEKQIAGMGLIVVGIQVTWRGAEGASHGSLKDYITGEVSALGGVAGGIIGGALIGGVPGAILGGFVVTLAGVVSAIKELVELKPSWDEFWYGVGHAYDDIPILGSWIEWLSETWSDSFDEMKNTFRFFKAIITGDIETIKEYVLTSEKESLPVVLQNTIDFVTDMTTKLYEFKETVKYYFNIIKNEIVVPVLEAFGLIENEVDERDWKDTFNPILSGASSILTDLIDLFEKWTPKMKVPEFRWDYNNGFKVGGALKAALEVLGLPTTIPKLKVKWYEGGGYPTSGDLFFANENGIPEMVGRIGNQTAVANNDQIATSLTNALLSALNQYDFGGGKSPTTIYIGNKKVYEGYGEYMNDENDRYGTNTIRI